MFLTTTLFVLCFCLFIPVFDSSVKFIFDVLFCVHLLTAEGGYSSSSTGLNQGKANRFFCKVSDMNTLVDSL